MTRHYETVEGLTTPEACEVLFNLAAAVPTGRSIVEIGVYRGRSLLALAEGSYWGEQVPVIGIDPWDLPRESKPKYSSNETYQAALDNVAASPAGHLVVLSRTFGVQAAARFSADTYGSVGMLYIDADHRKLPVLADFAAWEPHLAPGAVVAFDDCHSDFPGVVEAVNCLWQKRKISHPQMLTDRLAVSTLL